MFPQGGSRGDHQELDRSWVRLTSCLNEQCRDENTPASSLDADAQVASGELRILIQKNHHHQQRNCSSNHH